jgi:hypothetical protein
VRKSVKIASGTVGTAVLVGLGAGCAGGSTPVVHTVAHTVPDPKVTKTVAVPGPTVTKTVAVPGPTVTQTVAGPAQVVTVPGPVQVVNQPGPTVTQTVTAPAPTVTVTQTVSDPQNVSGPQNFSGPQYVSGPLPSGTVLDAFKGRGHEITPTFDVPAGGVYIVIWSYSGNTDPRRGSPADFAISQDGSGLRGDLPHDVAAAGQGRSEVTCAGSTTDSLNIQATGTWVITIEVSVVNAR